MSGIRLQPYRIAELTRLIAKGQVALPEFQRDFDWTDEQVASLIATVIKRWPAGSLLLMEGREDLFFRQREFEDAPKLAADIELIVLDGQQRLTGLYQAIYDTGRFVYAVRADVLRNDATVDEIEDSVKSVKREEWDSDFRGAPWTKSMEGWVPLYTLRSPADYFAWRDETVRHAQMSSGEKDRLGVRLADAYRESLESFHQYDLPSVIVEKRVEPAAVARIFERVNTTGIPLTTFDLMVARTFKDGWNLRDRWEAALADFSLFPKFFGENGLPALQVIALKYGGGVRQSDVLSLDADVVRKHWTKALRALDSAVQVLRNSCGVTLPAWLPYPGIMLTLAGTAINGCDLAAVESKIRQWFFSRVFGQRYEVAANTVTLEEITILEQWLGGSTSLPALRMDADMVASSSRRRRGAMWRGFMCVLSAEGSVDLHGRVTEDVGPINVLKRQSSVKRAEDPNHLLTLGFVLGTRQESRELAHAGVRELNEFLGTLGERRRHRLETKQLIPSSARSDSEFIEERLELLSDFLDRTTGYGLEWEEEQG
jgi:hypothetical protein